MKILITGGGGFVGSNLVRSLESKSNDFEIIVIDDFSFGFKRNLENTKAKIFEGSILDDDLLSKAAEGCSAIVHLAARTSVPRSVADPISTHLINATGTLKILEITKKLKNTQLIVASSSSVYGATPELPKIENLPTRPLSPYAASKLATESYSLAWAHCYNMPVLAFRFFNIFGPHQPPHHTYAAAIPTFLSAAFQNIPLPVYGDGNQTRDFTYVDSVTKIIISAIENQTTYPEPVNLAFGSQTSILELINEIEKILGHSLPINFLPPRVGDITHSYADNKVLQMLFPDVEATKLSKGIEETITWFEKEKPWDDDSLKK